MIARNHTLTSFNLSWTDLPISLWQSIFSLSSTQNKTTSNTTFSGYIGEFEIIDDHRSNKIVVELTGRLNKCGVISPRFDVKLDDIEKWIVNLLPSRQFGHIMLSTTYGIMTHDEARRKKTGGKILGFFY
jgi:ribosomal protein S8